MIMQVLEYTVVNDEYDPDYRETIFYIVDTDKEDLIQFPLEDMLDPNIVIVSYKKDCGKIAEVHKWFYSKYIKSLKKFSDSDLEVLISEYGETVRFLMDEIKTSNKVIKISKLM